MSSIDVRICEYFRALEFERRPSDDISVRVDECYLRYKECERLSHLLCAMCIFWTGSNASLASNEHFQVTRYIYRACTDIFCIGHIHNYIIIICIHNNYICILCLYKIIYYIIIYNINKIL